MTGKKLLVADDSLTIQKVIRLALSNEGYEIQAVSDGNDALQQISVFRPNVVLVDVSLPGRSAFELKTAVNGKPDLVDVRFVLMSSAFEKIDEQQIENLKFHGRLTKPFDPAHLRQVLLDVLLLPAPEAPDADFGGKISLVPPEDADTEESGHEELSPDFSPIQPEPSPLVKEEKTAIIEDLWEPEPQQAPPKPPASVPPPSPTDGAQAAGGSEDDIRQLTESTIRMSGLDDLQWTVSETSKKPLPEVAAFDEPITPPPPRMTPPQAPDSAFVVEGFRNQEPVLPPPPAMADLQNVSFRFDPPGTTPPAMPPFNPDQVSAQAIPLSNEQVEEVIMKMAEKILPDLAERLLKQEIHRLLSEQP